MSNCNCGNYGSGPQSRPLEDWEYPDKNEPTYDRNDDPEIYDDLNYSATQYNDSYGDEYGGVAYAGASYSPEYQDNPSDRGGCQCGASCGCGKGHTNQDEEDDEWKTGEEDEDDNLIVRCPKCGTELYDDDTECPRCGHYIVEDDNQNVPLWIIITGSILLVAILFGMTYYR